MTLHALLLAALVQSGPEGGPIPGLFRCTEIAVRVVDTVDSADARPGDFFRFETINAVTVKHHVVIPARTMGYGVVVIAASAGAGGRSGTLVLEPRYLVLPSGAKLGVVMDHNIGDLERTGSSGSAPGYLGALPVPAIGAAIGVFNYFHHGKNIAVKKGAIFEIFPSDDPSVERCQST